MYLSQSFFVILIAYYAFGLNAYDFKVPFQYSGDSIIILMYVKGFLQDGWPTTISHLSAPFSYSGAAFPMLTSIDWLIMKGVALFTDEPGFILNYFWLGTLIFSALAAGFSFYQLGMARYFALVIGVLYAFLPYALIRNVGHLSLVYYLVPLLCLLSVVIVTKGEGVRNLRHAKLLGLLACVLQGFNYIYYSFFAVLIFGISAILAWRRTGGVRQFLLPILAIFLVSAATALNLLPSLISTSKNGPPPDMGYKYTAEVEIYGAKIRKMLAPHSENVLFPLARYAEKDSAAGFPNENENVSARLGLFGAVGLVFSMLVVLRRRIAGPSSMMVFALSSLSIATLFVVTVGGLGAVINLLTVPDIRAYNRYSVFLSFFTMGAFGLWAQSKVDLLMPLNRMFAVLAIIFFALFSLYDQLLDKKILLASQRGDVERALGDRGVVEVLEQALPDGAAVLQLPLTGYPPLSKFHDMESYDHARAYLWSHDLRWSWPSFSTRHRAWQTRISKMRGLDLARAAILSGFQAIWIDRAAYADRGADLISELKQGRVTTISLPSDRFVVLDLQEEAAVFRSSMSVEEFNRLAAEVMGPEVVIDWGEGFYEEEKSGDGFLFRWSQNQSKMTIRNFGDHDLEVCLKFVAASPSPGSLSLSVSDSETIVSVDTMGKLITLPISIPARDAKRVIFGVDVARLKADGDPRNLYFFVKDYRVDAIKNSSECSNSGG